MSKYGKESDNLEFKSKYTKKSLEEIDGFLNSEGGTILFGVDDNGDPSEIKDLNELQLQVSNAIYDSILPDPGIYFDIKQKNNEIVKLDIKEGENKPYYLKSKGLNSKGVFLRKGSGNYHATEEEIKAMIRQSDGYSYEDARSPIQDLTFKETSNYFKDRNIQFDSKFKTLGLIQPETGLYTNLALLLSDQNPYSIKVATFSDKFKTEFLNRKEFFGSVFKQLDDILDFISIVNNNSFKIKRQYRIEKSDYPESSLREAIINSIIHRDYDIGGSSFIKFNSEEMEVTSFGCILKGLQIEDLKQGVSRLRNPKLANIFYRLELIEAYGTGIVRIFSDYDNEEIKPEINLSPNTFKIKLPNRNYKKHQITISNLEEINQKEDNDKFFELTNKQFKLLTSLESLNSSKAKVLMDRSKIGKSTFYNIINRLISLKLVTYSTEKNIRIYSLTNLGKNILKNNNYIIKNN